MLSKPFFLALFFCLVSLMSLSAAAQSSDLTRALETFERGDYAEAKPLLENHRERPEALLYLAQLAREDDLDEAEELFEEAFEKISDDTGDDVQAEIYYQHAVTMGAQASNSIFSAFGYAKKALTSFKQAVALAPEDISYRKGLMFFYIIAPGIAGGDLDLAWEEVEAIREINPREGMIAELDYIKATDVEAFDARLAEALEEFADAPDLYYVAGIAAQQEERHADAHELFTRGSQQPANDEYSERARLNSVYQIGRTALFSESNVEAGIAAIQTYLDENPADPALPSLAWAELRLAGLYALQDNREAAITLLEPLTEHNDEDLQKSAQEMLATL